MPPLSSLCRVLALVLGAALAWSPAFAPRLARAQGTPDTEGDGGSGYELQIDAEPHHYWTRQLADPFTAFKADLEAGTVDLDYSSEKAFLISLLNRLEIPVASQMLVFSTTSLQLRLISPRNPRAIYFNEDLYIGYIPGGRIEVVSLDPEVGGIFYIFDIPQNGAPAVVERSDRCMNCHAAPETGRVPGVIIKSVIPGPRGGSLDAFRRDQTGHGIPLSERFGGWHLTGKHGIEEHWGNQIGEMSPKGINTTTIVPGERFDFSKFPVQTSDILPHLLHEHQAGFVNRVLQASYRARTWLHEGDGQLGKEQVSVLDKEARELVQYLLFADEAELPDGGIEGDPAYVEQFTASRRVASNGLSLKDLDLGDRLFRYRCSYMIYSRTFEGLPPLFKRHVYRVLGEALDGTTPTSRDFAYLPRAEKAAIRAILRDTLTDLPEGW